MSNLESPLKVQEVFNQFKVTGDPFFFTKGTCDEVRNVLGQIYHTRSLKSTRIRIWYGNVHTGRAWNDTYNVTGYVGRTAARYPQPVVQQFKSSMSGEVLNTEQIVQIVIVETGEVAYSHRHFHVPAFAAYANAKESFLQHAHKYVRRLADKLQQRLLA